MRHSPGPVRDGGPSGTPEPEVLDLARPFTVSIPDSSVTGVRKVARLDGRTRIVAARRPGGSWYRLRERLRFTRIDTAELREAGISELVLRRGLHRASFPLAWLHHRAD